MIVVDNAVPYPRQYLAKHQLQNGDKWAGYLVPYAGAKPYWVWWSQTNKTVRPSSEVPTEATLQTNHLRCGVVDGWVVRTYPYPAFIDPAVLFPQQA